jgi:hypothetical protein
MAMPDDEPTAEELQEMYAGYANVYDKAADHAFKAGDYDKALLFIGVCRNMDPSRAELWAERSFRVKQAETQRTPLAELMERRTPRLSRGKDDPAIRHWAEQNMLFKTGRWSNGRRDPDDCWRSDHRPQRGQDLAQADGRGDQPLMDEPGRVIHWRAEVEL